MITTVYFSSDIWSKEEQKMMSASLFRAKDIQRVITQVLAYPVYSCAFQKTFPATFSKIKPLVPPPLNDEYTVRSSFYWIQRDVTPFLKMKDELIKVPDGFSEKLKEAIAQAKSASDSIKNPIENFPEFFLIYDFFKSLKHFLSRIPLVSDDAFISAILENKTYPKKIDSLLERLDTISLPYYQAKLLRYNDFLTSIAKTVLVAISTLIGSCERKIDASKEFMEIIEKTSRAFRYNTAKDEKEKFSLALEMLNTTKEDEWDSVSLKLDVYYTISRNTQECSLYFKELAMTLSQKINDFKKN